MYFIIYTTNYNAQYSDYVTDWLCTRDTAIRTVTAMINSEDYAVNIEYGTLSKIVVNDQEIIIHYICPMDCEETTTWSLRPLNTLPPLNEDSQ